HRLFPINQRRTQSMLDCNSQKPRERFMFPADRQVMNHSALLHIVERLESLVGKLPESIRKPVLSELTPLKELFLQQRAPRFVFTGFDETPLLEIVARVFAPSAEESPSRATLTGLYRWQKIALGKHGSIEVLDARGADDAALELVREALRQQRPDLF